MRQTKTPWHGKKLNLIFILRNVSLNIVAKLAPCKQVVNLTVLI